MVEQKAIVTKGSTKNKFYQLHPLVEWEQAYSLTGKLEEDIVWTHDIKMLLLELPDNVKSIWAYGFNEMLNNAIDHSFGKEVMVVVVVENTAINTQIMISDDGEGIF